MDSYLANIDTYMQQQQQEELLLSRERQQQMLQQQRLQQHQQQQQQQRQQQQQQHNSNFQPLPVDEEWLRNMSNLSVRPTPGPFYPEPAMYMSNIPNDAYSMSSNEYSLPPQEYSSQPTPSTGYDVNGEPIRIRKKPGRKPNPASPALRKAQNRAAQRAFRERKERHLKDLETTIRNLRDQRNNATRELNSLKGNLESYKAENWYLKGVVLTLQFICMHHNINIPTHSPYLSEDSLTKMAQIAPHAIEAYVNAYTRNNYNLKSTMSYHFIDKNDNNSIPEHQPVSSESPNSYHDDQDEYMDHEDQNSFASPSPQPQSVNEEEKEKDSNKSTWSTSDLDNNTSPLHPPTSSLDAIQHIRLKLGVQSTLNNANDEAAARLKPTILQLAIPHDPRIDLVPTPHMRDRMIIFRDQMDYDRCFSMMLNEAVYHGGDPTMSESWELPADFFSEFWYLTIDYDIKKTNKWRRKKGLADVAPGPQQQDLTKSVVWNSLLQQGEKDQAFDEVLDQFVQGMPTLQPFDQRQGEPTTPDSKYKDSHKSIYTRLMSAPESRQRVISPSLENMIDLINDDLP